MSRRTLLQRTQPTAKNNANDNPSSKLNDVITILESDTENSQAGYDDDRQDVPLGKDHQAFIPENTCPKFHSDHNFHNHYETCLWKPPTYTVESDHRRFLKDLDTFLKSFLSTQYSNNRQLNEDQILAISKG